MTYAEFLARYPLNTMQTGGGCMALHMQLTTNHYLLVTADADANVPSDDSISIELSVYDDTVDDGTLGSTSIDDTSVPDFDTAASVIDLWIGRYASKIQVESAPLAQI
jgi:hypothetical protein